MSERPVHEPGPAAADGEHPSCVDSAAVALLGGENPALMQAMDRQYLDTPFYGSRRIQVWLPGGHTGKPEAGAAADESHGVEGHLEGPRTSRPAPEHRVYPYRWKRSELPGPTRRGPPTSPTCPGPGIPLPRGHHGLAQPVCGGLAVVQHLGGRLLRRCLRLCQPEVFNTDRAANSPAWNSPKFCGIMG